MKVFGQLEAAQLEQVNGTVGLSTPRGRVVLDISTTPAKPKMFISSSWQEIALSQLTALISQNSGKTCTVDWSTGLNQEVVLSDNCIISFSNPVEGQVHRLVVRQKTYTNGTPLGYIHRFNMIDQDCHGKVYQPVGLLGPNQTRVYSWFYKTAARVGYGTVPNIVGNVISDPGSAGFMGDFSYDGFKFGLGNNTSPFAMFYSFYTQGNIPSFGPKNIPTPSTVLTSKGIMYSPKNNFIFSFSNSSTYLQAFPCFSYSFSSTEITTMVTALTGAAQCAAVHPSGEFVVAGHTTTPFMSCYPITGSGWGTKVTNPATLPAAQVNAVAWSPCGAFLAAVGQTTPFLQVWPFSTASGGSFGAVVANPGTLPVGGPAGSIGKALAWRPQGDYIAVVGTTTPYLEVWAFNRTTGAFGTKLVSLITPSATPQTVQWTPDGQYLLMGGSGGTFLTIYDFSNADLNTLVTYDSSNPGQTINDITVHPSGDFIVASLNASPYVRSYALPTKQRNYFQLFDDTPIYRNM